MTELAFVVPGPLDQLTGGYLFDRRIVDGLRALGEPVAVIELPGRFPAADEVARAAGAAALARLPDGAPVAIDGLALGAFADCLADETTRLRVVALVHHPLALETGLDAPARDRLAALERGLLPLCRGVLCPSARSAAAVAAYGVPAAGIAVTPPGTAKPGRLPDRAGRAGALRLLAVGTLTPRKGHLLLVEALASLADRDWCLQCIGSLDRDPPTVAGVRAAIERHGLGGRVQLSGEWPPELLQDAYRWADVFVLPSWLEGYGMAFAEALAWGLPIVATTGGAIPDTVPPDAGLLVPPGDAPALAAALRRVLDDAPLRARLAAGAGAAGTRLPDWPEAVRRWRAAFARLAA